MTRLISEQVLKIPATLEDYDRQLQKKIGWNLKELAQAAAGFNLVTTGISPATATKGPVFIANQNNVADNLSPASAKSAPGALPNPPRQPNSGSGTKPANDSTPAVSEPPAPANVNSAAATPLNTPAAHRVAVIPVTSGQGTIQGFTKALSAIATHLGFPAFITSATDVAGLAEAYNSNATIALMADDHFYAAFNLLTRRVAGNDEATAKGYTAALKKMAGSLTGKEVLLIGLGPLGIAAAQVLLQEGAKLILYDLVREKETALIKSCTTQEQQRITTGLNLEQALARTPLIFDASPGEAFIPATLLHPSACIAAPGLPLGLDPAASSQFADRLIHDPLQIGTATMLFQALI